MSVKRAVLLLTLLVCSLSLLFAEEEVNPNLNYSSKFFLAHSVNRPDVSFHSEVWDPSNKKITTVTLASAGFHQLGSFVLVFNSTVVFTSIKIKFEALTSAETNAQGAYDCYPYSMYVYKPGSTTVIGGDPIVTELLSVDEERYFVGDVELLNTDNGEGEFKKQYSYLDWDSRKLADFAIELDDSNVPAGTYSGYVVIVFTPDGGTNT